MGTEIRKIASSKTRNAAGKPSSDSGREGTGEDSRRLFSRTAPAGQAVLRDERERRPRAHLSHEGVGRNRKEAREAFFAQSGQAQIPGANELLRTSGGA